MPDGNVCITLELPERVVEALAKECRVEYKPGTAECFFYGIKIKVMEHTSPHPGHPGHAGQE